MAAPKGNKNATGNKGGGRKNIYNKRFAKVAQILCEYGATDKDLAEAFEVSVTTIGAWKKRHVEFHDALKKGKPIADEMVKQALYNRAIGCSHPDVHITNYQGEIIVTPITKHYAPDTTACIFWLKNRQPENWRDKQVVNTDDIAEAFMKLAQVLPT